MRLRPGEMVSLAGLNDFAGWIWPAGRGLDSLETPDLD